jgi:hypothetical protein
MVKVNPFSQILAHVFREKFQKLVNRHQSGKQGKGILDHIAEDRSTC